MNRPACFAELTELISALCDETITDTQFARLNELLEKDPEARSYYAIYMDMHCGLNRHWGAPESVPNLIVAPERTPRAMRHWGIWAVSIAALIALTSALTLIFAGRFSATPESIADPKTAEPVAALQSEKTSDSVAMLAAALDVIWSDPSASQATGAPLSPGWLRLKSGTAAIQFYTGATVILQGPAELQLISTGEAFCRSGRLSAEVPQQAQGFSIGTPHVVATDLGTEFGMEVNEDGAEIHVLKGEVALTRATAKLDNLKEGQAIAVQRDGVARRFAARKDAFVTVQQVVQSATEKSNERTKQWLASAEAFDSDPALQAHFNFEKLALGARVLKNLATNSSGSDGLIVGCGISEGRWPGKGALEFRNMSDRVRLILPGEYKALTLSAWVRIDSLDHLFSSLLMVDAYNSGAFHWQISNTGKVILGVAGPKNGAGFEHADYASPAVITPDRFGRWMHLALIYDSETGEARHYLDGTLILKLPLRYKRPLQIGNCELGNWNPGSHVTKYPIRNLNGRIDEFSIHSRPLSDSEIAQLYALGTARTPDHPKPQK